ncbi:hypothetical protein DB30_02431 [Enhygromyxa salina]|uniref:Uncharacterized protein n=1 Tax=Enhygromyxa salina TaxID=215803 RepID=A0A0C2CVB7_9BACT|nr:hypothetical protein DB30_02431 [Enhygromyxa salina]
MGMNPKTITGSDLYKEFSSEFEKEDDFKEAMKAFEDCGLKPTEFDAIVVGASQSEDFVAVIVGDGIGEDDNASCVIKNIQKMSGEDEAAEVSKEDGKKIIQFTDGRAYLVNKNMLALSTTEWETKVGELIDGKGTPAIENGKKDLYGKVDSKAAVWFIADVPAELAGMAAMAAPEATEVKTVAGSVDLSKGVAVEFVAGFGDDAKAKATADKIQELFDGLKGEAPAELKGVVESVKIEAAGPDVKLGVSASMDDIKAGKDSMPI